MSSFFYLACYYKLGRRENGSDRKKSGGIYESDIKESITGASGSFYGAARSRVPEKKQEGGVFGNGRGELAIRDRNNTIRLRLRCSQKNKY